MTTPQEQSLAQQLQRALEEGTIVTGNHSVSSDGFVTVNGQRAILAGNIRSGSAIAFKASNGSWYGFVPGGSEVNNERVVYARRNKPVPSGEELQADFLVRGDYRDRDSPGAVNPTWALEIPSGSEATTPNEDIYVLRETYEGKYFYNSLSTALDRLGVLLRDLDLAQGKTLRTSVDFVENVDSNGDIYYTYGDTWVETFLPEDWVLTSGLYRLTYNAPFDIYHMRVVSGSTNNNLITAKREYVRDTDLIFDSFDGLFIPGGTINNDREWVKEINSLYWEAYSSITIEFNPPIYRKKVEATAKYYLVPYNKEPISLFEYNFAEQIRVFINKTKNETHITVKAGAIFDPPPTEPYIRDYYQLRHIIVSKSGEIVTDITSTNGINVINILPKVWREIYAESYLNDQEVGGVTIVPDPIIVENKCIEQKDNLPYWNYFKNKWYEINPLTEIKNSQGIVIGVWKDLIFNQTLKVEIYEVKLSSTDIACEAGSSRKKRLKIKQFIFPESEPDFFNIQVIDGSGIKF